MSDVQPEAQALHLRLYERYVNALIDRMAAQTDKHVIDEYMDRIERLLALDFPTTEDFSEVGNKDALLAPTYPEVETEPQTEEAPPESEGIPPESYDSPSIVVTEPDPAYDVTRGGQGRCRFCGHGSNSKHHKENCTGHDPVSDEQKQAVATAMEEAIFTSPPVTQGIVAPIAIRQEAEAVAELLIPSKEEAAIAVSLTAERCPRCNAAMRYDDDPRDRGFYCLMCGHRPRTQEDPMALLNEDRKQRRRGPNHAGAQL